ncbi:hypothetical protein BCAR13_890058 [Paraburkholderia caribensis]|nr:hypothetical protein BCAR13_890058 [Paraburkholderia caribensis]
MVRFNFFPIFFGKLICVLSNLTLVKKQNWNVNFWLYFIQRPPLIQACFYLISQNLIYVKMIDVGNICDYRIFLPELVGIQRVLYRLDNCAEPGIFDACIKFRLTEPKAKIAEIIDNDMDTISALGEIINILLVKYFRDYGKSFVMMFHNSVKQNFGELTPFTNILVVIC